MHNRHKSSEWHLTRCFFEVIFQNERKKSNVVGGLTHCKTPVKTM